MKKTIYFDSFEGETIAAVTEDGKLIEYAIETNQTKEIVGNIYKGRVTNILNGMQAAFVNCGLDRNCYLSVTDILKDASILEEKAEELQKELDLNVGDEVIVQVIKDPIGKKGAKVTRNLSFVGKNVIYLPNTDFIGVSRKISDTELRATLAKQAEKLRKNTAEGVIMRTSSPTATAKELLAEVRYLRDRSERVQKACANAKVGDLLYEEISLPLRILRETKHDEIEAIYISDGDLFRALKEMLTLQTNPLAKKLTYYDKIEDIFSYFELDEQIETIFRPKVPLSFGANLVIEHTEAMTVIDVNTAGFIGDENLENTAFSTNILAAREVARQVRLRNIAGIITVDFVDMTDEEHRNKVVRELEYCLKSDKAKCRVMPMNDLCLVSFSRQRLTPAIFGYMRKPCPHCKGEGSIQSDIYLVHKLRSAINEQLAQGYKNVIVDLNSKLMNLILSERIFTPLFSREWKDCRIYLIPHKTYHEETLRLQGTDEELTTLPNGAQMLY